MILLPSTNEREVFSALHLRDRDLPSNGLALVAVRLIGRGYPPIVAGRVALTPSLSATARTGGGR